MADSPVTSILVIASTATTENADSNMFIEVFIPGVAATEAMLAGALGATHTVTMAASGSKTVNEISPADITISTEPPNEGNAWLPASLYVLGKSDESDYQVICAIPQWPSDIWLSEDPNSHQNPPAFSAVTLDQVLAAATSP